MKKIIIYIVLICINHILLFGQENFKYSLGPIKIINYGGSLLFDGSYRSQSNELINFYDVQNSLIYSFKAKLNTNTYIWNPKFLKMDFNIEYNPFISNDNFIVMPSRSENTNNQLFALNGLFFETKDINLSFSINSNSTNSVRDFGSTFKINSTSYGTAMNYFNSIAPLNISFNQQSTKDEDLDNSRTFEINKSNFTFGVTKSLFNSIDNKLSFSIDEFKNKNNGANLNDVLISEFRMDNSVIIDSLKNHIISSNFILNNTESIFKQERLNENVMMRNKLSSNLNLFSSFFYDKFKMDSLESNTLSFQSRMEHQLFKSLLSHVYYQYYSSKNYSSNETRNQVGAILDYNKKITWGILNLKYEFKYDKNDRVGTTSKLIIVNEEHNLSDQSITKLTNPYINISTIRITDVTQSIIYIQDIDYQIIEIGDFIEVKRIPGGKILNNSMVYVSYQSENPQNYNYNMISNSFNLKFSLFDNFLDIFSSTYFNNFSNVQFTKFVVLDKIFSKSLGFQINHDYVNFFYEFQDYESNIMPYRHHDINISNNSQISDYIIINTFFNYSYYDFATLNDINQYLNLSTRGSLAISKLSLINLELGYLQQSTKNGQSDYLNFKLEYVLRYAQINLSSGIEMYHRKIDFNKNDYLNFFVKVERYF